MLGDLMQQQSTVGCDGAQSCTAACMRPVLMGIQSDNTALENSSYTKDQPLYKSNKEGKTGNK